MRWLGCLVVVMSLLVGGLAAVPVLVATALRASAAVHAARCGEAFLPDGPDEAPDDAAPSSTTPVTSVDPPDDPCADGDGSGGSDDGPDGGGGPSGPGGGGVVGDGEIVSVRSCGGSFSVHRSIGETVAAMLLDACGDGIVLGGWGWRSHQRQIELRRAHCGPTHYDIWQKPSGSCHPPTARPGFSQHERGLAIDFTQGGASLTRASSGYRWLAANARRYGMYNLASEPWHWSTTGR